jgi:hypothetical protein
MKAERIKQLKKELEELDSKMVRTFTEQRNRNRVLFEICKELEELENPESYEANRDHWDGHEIRL